MPLIKSKDDYRNIFCFPVEAYYRKLGFDFEKYSFSLLAKEFIDIYQHDSMNCNLTDNAENTLLELYNLGFNQIILSASKQENLIEQVNVYNIDKYFDCILGISNIYANCKIDIAIDWIRKKKISNSNLIIIGDTIHDYEVSKELNCECILYNNGHQDISDLYNCTKVNNLNEILELLRKNG